METKKGKVVAVYGNGTWESPNGLLYRFEIEMDNGDRGQYLSKTQDCAKFPKGGDVWYTTECQVRNGKEYYRIKPSQDPNASAPVRGGGGGYQKDPETEKRITRMSVLKVACDLVVNGQGKLHDLTKIASILEQYVMTGEDTVSKAYSTPQKTKPTSGIVQNFQEEAIKDMVDDLPF